MDLGVAHRKALPTKLRRRSTVSLVQIAPVLRQRFHDVVGDRIFAAYRPTEMPDCATADAKAHTTLYDDLATVVGAIHWRYILYPFNSQIRTTLTLQALLWMLFYTGLWALTIYKIQSHANGPFIGVLITCLYAGVLGGFISALRRMQSVGDDSDSVFVIQGIRAARFWLWFSPLLGGVFAAVALLFFLSGVLGGSIFPAFHSPLDVACAQHPCDYLAPSWWFWRNLLPISQSDYAKLFLWCFISGFAERLIPDMIDNLMNRVDSSRPGAATPSTPVSVGSRPPTPPTPPGPLPGAAPPTPGTPQTETESAGETPGTTVD